MHFAHHLPACVLRATMAALGLLALSCAIAQPIASGCGELANGYGPYDYRTDRDKLPIVENHHFTPPVEALIRGISGTVGGELDYVLRAFPNHHRALVAMTRLSERSQWQRPSGAQWDIDCYFDLALRFRPADVISRLLYADYLAKRSRRDEAQAQLARSTGEAGDNGFTHYNIGLQYLGLKQFDKAVEQAHRALELGFTRPELANQLRAAGRWKEPEVPRAVDAPSPTASAAR